MTTPIGQAVTSKLVPWLRTIIPVGWSALIAWAATAGVLPHEFESWANGAGSIIATFLITAVVYPAIRWAEPRIPDWLSRLLIGSIQQPVYVPPAVVEQAESAGPDPVVTVTTDKPGGDDGVLQ